MLAICRNRSNHQSCPVNQAFALKARKLGGIAAVLPMDLSPGEINAQLGLPGTYTEFMRGLGWKL